MIGTVPCGGGWGFILLRFAWACGVFTLGLWCCGGCSYKKLYNSGCLRFAYVWFGFVILESFTVLLESLLLVRVRFLFPCPSCFPFVNAHLLCFECFVLPFF